MEIAALGFIHRIGHTVGDLDEHMALVRKLGNSTQQALGIGMIGLFEQLIGRGFFHDLAAVHNTDRICHVSNDGQS